MAKHGFIWDADRPNEYCATCGADYSDPAHYAEDGSDVPVVWPELPDAETPSGTKERHTYGRVQSFTPIMPTPTTLSGYLVKLDCGHTYESNPQFYPVLGDLVRCYQGGVDYGKLG